MDYYLETYIWPTKFDEFGLKRAGHASLKIISSLGDKYLSFWPGKKGKAAKLKTYEEDFQAEGGHPEGAYKLVISQEQADAMYKNIVDIETSINSQQSAYHYTSHNQDKGKGYFNCSGIIENVISENIKEIKFGDPKESFPTRTAFILSNTSGVIVIKESDVLQKQMAEVTKPHARL